MSRTKRRSRRVFLAALLGALAGCGEHPPQPGGVPLLDDLHVPEILIERPRIARPPADDANRFLSGWFPWLDEGRVALGASAAGARLQLVHLAPRARELVLDLVDVDDRQGRVRVTAAGRSLGTYPLTDPLEIPLPADLPLGRVEVEIVPIGTPTPPLDVLAAGVRPVLAAGAMQGDAVQRDGRDLIQSGDSRVELVREVEAGAELAGELVLPESPNSGQSFRITLSVGDEEGEKEKEKEDEASITRFEWAPGRLGRFRGARRFRLPAGLGGRVKITLEARGAGPPARWRDLRWIERGHEERTTDPDSEPPADLDLVPPRAVVVYVMDALRADHVGHLGGPEGISPTWDRLAREGFTFTRHRCVAPSTLPSTRALFSGHIFRFREEYGLIDEMPLLAERFRQAGYRTGLFSGNGYVSPAYGLDRGFDHVAEEVLYGPDSPSERGGVNVNAARVQEAALAWLDTLAPGERAFLYLHTIHPHNPYAPPPDLARRFTAGIESSIDGRTDTLFAVRDGRREVDTADQERLGGLYAAAFAYNDRELAKLVAALEQRFEVGEVLVILTSDHGEELFEHDGVLHGYTLYEEMLRIPLTLWWPGHIPPGSYEGATDALDLHASLLDLLGDLAGELDRRSPAGRSLWPRILGEVQRLPPRLHFAAAPGVREGIFSVVDGGDGSAGVKLVAAARTYIGWGMGKGRGRSRDPEYFFDLGADPGERVNRTGAGGLDEQELRSRLRAWIRAGEAAREAAGSAQERELDPETRERLRSLGYLR